MIALSCLVLSEGCKLTNISSLFPSFLSFSVVVGICSLGVVIFDSGRDFVNSANRGTSIVLTVVISVEKSMVSRSGDCEVIVGVGWYLGHLLTSILVLVFS